MTDPKRQQYQDLPGLLILDILKQIDAGKATASQIARGVFQCDRKQKCWKRRYALVYRTLREMAADGMVRRFKRSYSSDVG